MSDTTAQIATFPRDNVREVFLMQRAIRSVVACLVLLPLFVLVVSAAASEPCTHEVGLAKVDITPDYNIRLSGFAFRQTESTGVREHIYARALAIRAKASMESSVMVAVESIGVPLYLRDEVAMRLRTKKGIANEQFAVCSTHSHTAPVVDKVLPTMFGAPLPQDHQKRVEQYTQELTDKIEQAALAALADMRPARLAYGIGKVGFAINRRTRGGPVDHDLPVLSITDPNGTVRGVWLNYACHCVVLSDYKVSGDWAGYASKVLERLLPTSTVLVSIGCGADSNPQSGVTGDKAGVAEQYGHEVAAEVERLLRTPLTPIHDDVNCHIDKIQLPLQSLPTREQWVERATEPSYPGYHAKVMLQRLEAGQKLPTKIPLVVQTWKFGRTLAMVFISGEVVVDYSLRLKRQFDPTRLWVNSYSNDVPCYIPSERILREGGYEGGGAMVYYGWPAPLAPGLEDEIVGTVEKQLADEFKAASSDRVSP